MRVNYYSAVSYSKDPATGKEDKHVIQFAASDGDQAARLAKLVLNAKGIGYVLLLGHPLPLEGESRISGEKLFKTWCEELHHAGQCSLGELLTLNMYLDWLEETK
jgi:hypothetical protein